jgi:GH15 family glucan-1,4-alpha-glucosidase
MSNYPPIADHGLIGDLQTAALVATDGTIDWFCCPRFDSPSVFASLLDHSKGGHFALSPVGTECVSKQMYLPDTAVLVTRFLSPKGVAEVVDFMPIEKPAIVTDHHRLVRTVRGVRGELEFEADIRPRFDYGRESHKTQVDGTNAVFEAPSMTAHLTGTMPLEQDGQDVRARFTVRAGDFTGIMLESAEKSTIGHGEMIKLFTDTIDYWKQWLRTGTYRGRWREAVARSAMTLKLMTYAPTGALVAAPTAGLPEQVGGERNWDYRYTWVRDASFSVYALLGSGFTDEAVGFGYWLRNTMEQSVANDIPLKLMYRVDGSSDLEEETLDHFEGYRGSSPVRIGNGAADQLQLDIYGEAMDSIRFTDRAVAGIGDRGWNDIVGIMDWLCEHWNEPDEGIWETRGGRKAFTYSRLMEWVAFDRAIRMAIDHGWPADLPRWTKERDEIYRWIQTKGWNDSMKAYVQYEGSDVLDASLLLMPLIGFASPVDEKWQSTLTAMDKVLVSDSLVYRYDPKASPDGLQGEEGTFSLCTFFYVDALARSGRLEDARMTFEKMLTYANHVGLFAEEIGLTGEQLGNFPQAFTHLALINAAMNLDYQLDHGAGRVNVVSPGPGS